MNFITFSLDGQWFSQGQVGAVGHEGQVLAALHQL